MVGKSPSPADLKPKELEAVYAISRAVALSEGINQALDDIVNLTRSVFIFDNMVLYLVGENETLEPRYARVIGRGRSAEANLAWGDALANDVYHSLETMTASEQLDGWQEDRLASRFFLGIPLRLTEGILGALVFGRFGGPPYSPDQTHLAEFIASHIAQLVHRQHLVERIANLEADRRLSQLQHDFIAMITHELNTPLGFIKGYATTLLRKDTTWDENSRLEFLTVIDEEADRLRELIDDLLDSSRLQAGTLKMTFEAVRLDTLLRDIISRVQSRSDETPPRLVIKSSPVIQGDPIRLAQVFDNLLSNAAKYAPQAPVTIILEANKEQVHIIVKDEGPGIAPEHLDKIFERFYRIPDLQTAARGTGMGLFICRQIVSAHRGIINAESEPGKGAAFHITLPLSQPSVIKPGG